MIPPKKFRELYTTEFKGGLLLAFNPQFDKGVTLLNKGAQKVFNLVDGRRDVKEIFSNLEKSEKSLEIKDIEKVVDKLERCKLIYTSEKAPSFKFLPTDHFEVWIHMTNQCNLRCPYCYVERGEETLSLETGKKAVDSILLSMKKNGLKRLTLKFAGGEPVLALDTVTKIADYAKKEGVKSGINTRCVLLTNGTLINTENINEIKGAGLHVALAIDGWGRTHDKTRVYADGKGSFKDVFRALQLLLRKDVSSNVSTVVTSKNVDSLVKLVRFAMKNKVGMVFNFVRDNPQMSEKNLVAENEKLVKGMKKVYEEIKKWLPNRIFINRMLNIVNINRPHLNPCGMGNSYAVITPSGGVAVCQMRIKEVVGDINHPDTVNLVKENNFVRPKNLTPDQKTGCKQCLWRYLCAGGCPNVTFAKYGRYDTRSPYCSAYKALIPEVLKLEAERILATVSTQSNWAKRNHTT